MNAYDGLNVYFGDLHNHCGISYGHGTIEEAFANASEQLDFCSVTGHALWPDMPKPTPETRHIIDYHEKGFARLREQWTHVKEITQAQNCEGRFVTFLSFEVHCSADGDYTVMYRGGEGEILEADGVADLRDKLRALKDQGVEAIAFPHHIAYKRGRRGINWDTFTEEFSPVVEIVSMHGCSEGDECPRPFLHTMGPADRESTMCHGLSRGHVFGVIGSTDHHSAHPGSFGHGRAAVWAREKTRASIWRALQERRTYALTGDRIRLEFSVNGAPMGTVLQPEARRHIDLHVVGGGAIDNVDVVKNGRLLRRFCECDVPQSELSGPVRTKLHLEVGWGARGRRVDWHGTLGISEGAVLDVEPRFRGAEVVSPLEEGPDAPSDRYFSHWQREDERTVSFRTSTFGNPNNLTNANQGICLHVEAPLNASVRATLNGRNITIPLTRLLDGAEAGYIGGIESPAYRFHRAPLLSEYDWCFSFDDDANTPEIRDVYYVRVRQKNDQWAWSSPVFVEPS